MTLRRPIALIAVCGLIVVGVPLRPLVHVSSIDGPVASIEASSGLRLSEAGIYLAKNRRDIDLQDTLMKNSLGPMSTDREERILRPRTDPNPRSTFRGLAFPRHLSQRTPPLCDSEGLPRVSVAIELDREAYHVLSPEPSETVEGVTEFTSEIFCLHSIADLTFQYFPDGYEYSSGRMCGLLLEFRERWLQDHPGATSTLAVLGTGKSFSTGIIGCAFQDGIITDEPLAVMRLPPYRASDPRGYTEETREYHAAILLAHELGHLMTARHSNAIPPPSVTPSNVPVPTATIMYPSIAFNSAVYSPQNRQDMRNGTGQVAG